VSLWAGITIFHAQFDRRERPFRTENDKNSIFRRAACHAFVRKVTYLYDEGGPVKLWDSGLGCARKDASAWLGVDRFCLVPLLLWCRNAATPILKL
jgi:hypothetical protein